ncbi:MAG: hypothetical protein PHP30_01220 [Bacteroidales bacterium]|nr:hypothetical protein [Bacteroidales bacterium]MDD2424619.1 hypothetical protein [Bacteroidales bacterium]MDD3988707.1 hypothetical protein [Bacteroidales bacterium]
MYRKEFINDFSELGEELRKGLTKGSFGPDMEEAVKSSETNNSLFTKNMILSAINNICQKYLNKEKLSGWLSRYPSVDKPLLRKCGILMAGNIPLVGFHDFLTVMAAGCSAEIKLSSKDPFLMPAISRLLSYINSNWKERISFTDIIDKNIDCLLLTGGDQALSFYRKVYNGIPSLERTSRSSLAILTGKETEKELSLLAEDIFLYYGMGCRSVSYMLLPRGYNIGKLAEALRPMVYQLYSEDFRQAYRYQKALLLSLGEEFIDAGFFILRQADSFPPPLGVVNYSYYTEEREIENITGNNRNLLQCIVGNYLPFCYIPFGYAQKPALEDYADGKDSLNFLMNFM